MFFITVALIAYFGSDGVWGSNTDWKSQHFAIPEYFRLRFYQTGDLFPDLALQIGSGQNIYNYAYYGLFNPLYFPAYLFPSLKMSVYIEFLSLAIVLVSSLISYKFFRRRFSPGIALSLALAFMFSGGLMFHSHRHVMFMNYFPFLLGMLLLCDKSDRARERFLMALFAFCIMCCSFYYAVGSFLTVGAYMVYLELEEGEKFRLSKFWKRFWRKLVSAALGCVSSAFLWAPVLSALLSGRAETSTGLSWKSELVPTVNLTMILHTGYSVGVTSFVVLAAIYLLPFGKKQDRFLSATLLACVFFPLINYLVNAGMYIDGKAFIPMAPLLLILCGRFFEAPKRKGKTLAYVLSIHGLLAAATVAIAEPSIAKIALMAADYSITIPVVALLILKKKDKFLPVAATGLAFVICLALNLGEKFVPKSALDEFYSGEIRSAIIDTIEEDDSLYRFADSIPNDVNVNRVIDAKYLSTNTYSSLSNSSLRDFRFNASLSENRVRNGAIQNQSYSVLFNTLMGCRYRIAPASTRMLGEEPVREGGGYTIFRNEFALPLGYASPNVMSEKEFLEIPPQLRAEALVENIIAGDGSETEVTASHTSEISFDMTEALKDKRLTYSKGAYTIKANENFTVTAPLERVAEDQFLVVVAKADNRIGKLSAQTDIALTINGVKNKLTDPKWRYNNLNYNFTYVISSYEPIKELKLTFTKGYYRISELRAYAVDASVLRDAMSNKDAFDIDRDASLGDSIKGSIDVTEDGWFTLSVPYDKGFHITVDGEDTEYYRTNAAFIGFPISAGSHDVEIVFEAPWKRQGLEISVAGALLLAGFALAGLIAGRKRVEKKEAAESSESSDDSNDL